MRSIVIDKLASVASDLGADREIRVGDRIPSEEGVMVAVEVLNEKSSYNQLELASGRMARVRRGDVIVGALGHRKALFGYSGYVPETTRPGDIVQILNMGGVLGICDAVNASLDSPSTRVCSGWCWSSPISASAWACRPGWAAIHWTSGPDWNWKGSPW